jgi:hypothetical protein
MPSVDERHIPLNVKTYREGFLRLQGWICVSALSFFTGALLVMYEVRCVEMCQAVTSPQPAGFWMDVRMQRV